MSGELRGFRPPRGRLIKFSLMRPNTEETDKSAIRYEKPYPYWKVSRHLPQLPPSCGQALLRLYSQHEMVDGCGLQVWKRSSDEPLARGFHRFQ